MKENRKNTRLHVVFNSKVIFKDGSEYFGKTKNISFGGVLVELDNLNIAKIGEGCTFYLLLQEEVSKVIIEFVCEVVHQGDTGIGLKFLTIDIDSYEIFKNLMVYNSNDPDKLLEELQHHPGLIIKN